MTLRLKDRVAFLSDTIGTGDLTVGAPVSSDFVLPSQVGFVNGETTYLVIKDGTNFEVCQASYIDASPDRFSRDTVLISKSGGVVGTSKLNLSGAAEVRLTIPADLYRAFSNFANKAELQAANIPIIFNSVVLDGYYAHGDAPTARYKRVNSQPAHIGKVQSADGAWWELDAAVVDVRMVGAIPTDPFAFEINQAAIQGALAIGRPVTLPDGYTFYTQQIVAGPGARSISGRATLVAGGTFPSPTGVLCPIETVDFKIYDLIIEVGTTSYAGLKGIHGTSNTNLLVKGVTSEGDEGIYDEQSIDTRIEGCYVAGYDFMGIHTRACTGVVIRGNRVDNQNQVLGGPAAYNIWTEDCSHVEITENESSRANWFGIVASGNGTTHTPATEIVISNNRVRDSGREGINVTNVQRFTITGNVVEWPTAGVSNDFGISTWVDPAWGSTIFCQIGVISGNSVYRSDGSGVALGGNSRYINVVGNTVYDANPTGKTADANKQGIFVFGGNASYNKVVGNNIIDPNARLTWAVREFNNGGAGGPPDHNSFSNNTGVGTSGQSSISGTNSEIGTPELWLKGANTTPGNTLKAAAIELTSGLLCSGVNGSVELGHKTTANTPFIDFNTGSNVDYDVRLIASGGSAGVLANGTLTAFALQFIFSVNDVRFNSSFCTAVPVIKTASYTQSVADGPLIFNLASGTATLTLLPAASYPGRWLLVKTIKALAVVSASSNVKPIGSDTAGTAILAATAGKWALLVSDGTNWVIMAAN